MTAACLSGLRSATGDAIPGETGRLAALRSYQVLDTSPEPAFDRIARLAALLLDVPIALISLLDADRHWFKARHGLDAPETPRAVAFCDHAIRGSDILVVPDAEQDPRFHENPLVTGDMHLRFYAGAPLITSDGFTLGTICAMDRVPRNFEPRDAAILTALAEQTVHELEIRSALGELYRRQEAADQTREKLAALGRVTGGMAHELNNLLQPIIGLTELELDLLPDGGSVEQMESRESLGTILESGRQARDVVRKVLMFARKAKPELALTDFSAAVTRTVASLGKLLPPAVHVEQIIEDGAVGMAVINEAELAEVMSNLALNAAYAMDASGTLTIRVERLQLLETASALGIATGCYFKVSIADTGRGMDASTRAQIFEPFFTTKPVGQGTGLGLSIVHGVLRDWRGTVAVDSSIGAGSTISLYVPVAETP